jgi:protochlorophyllide reductase
VAPGTGEGGGKMQHAMINGKAFKPGKAYQESKLCNVIISREMHRRYHADTCIIFNTLYPGCIAESRSLRDAPKRFQMIFPWFQKNMTKGYVSQSLAGSRVAQVVADDAFPQSGVHGSWDNRQKLGREAFAQPLSSAANDQARASRLWELIAELIAELTGLRGR